MNSLWIHGFISDPLEGSELGSVIQPDYRSHANTYYFVHTYICTY